MPPEQADRTTVLPVRPCQTVQAILLQRMRQEAQFPIFALAEHHETCKARLRDGALARSVKEAMGVKKQRSSFVAGREDGPRTPRHSAETLAACAHTSGSRARLTTLTVEQQGRAERRETHKGAGAPKDCKCGEGARCVQVKRFESGAARRP
eukprot:6191477-Pleurochrysis_carterae.AAC.2